MKGYSNKCDTRKLSDRHKSLALSVEEQHRFIKILSKPPIATKQLSKLMSLEAFNER